MKTKKNKMLATVLLIFALVFVTGGVYAAASGVLTFQGTATLNGTTPPDKDLCVELWETNPATAAVSNDGVSTGTMTISPDRQTADFTVNLANPGSEVYFTFDIKNVGQLDAYLYPYTINVPTGANCPIEFFGSYTSTGDTIIAAGATDANVTFGVRWKADAPVTEPTTINFQITSAYIPANA